MPRVDSPNHRVQRAFAPLIFKSRLPPEHVLIHSCLPWDLTFSPHVDLDGDLPAVAGNQTTPVKKPRPAGQSGRLDPHKGFVLKAELGLPDSVYKQIHVSVCHSTLLVVLTIHTVRFKGAGRCAS